MDNLRGIIAGKVGGYHTYMKKWERLGGRKPSSEIAADRIIAEFEAVLLSDEVVEAAAKAMHEANADYNDVDFMAWDRLGDDKRAWIHMARAALQAALA